jgi:hypothetical protein
VMLRTVAVMGGRVVAEREADNNKIRKVVDLDWYTPS